jgi:CRISPR-associated protein Cas2
MTWVVYDIAENATRTRVARICKDAGLYRVQKSVFLGNISADAQDTIALRCEETIDPEADSVYVFPMDELSFKRVRLLGQAFDKRFVSDEVLTQFF